MRRTSTVIRLLLVVGVAMVAVHWARPGGAEAQQSRSLDEELLDKLNTDPLDEFDRELFGPGRDSGRDSPSGEQGSGGQSPGTEEGDLADRLRRELGAAADPEDENPLLAVARKMRDVEQRIAGKDSGLTTRNLQGQIITDLDELIQQMRKRCRPGKPGDGRKQTASRTEVSQATPKPGPGQGTGANNPTQAGGTKPGNGTPRRPDMKEMEQVIRDLWGILPQRGRERVTQSPTPEFLPKYELLIEEYFRRLAEERSRE